MKFVRLLPLVAMSFTASACGQPEPLRAVSDFCLVDKAISVSPAPGPNAPDPRNEFDSDQTTIEVLQHNVVHSSLCGKKN